MSGVAIYMEGGGSSKESKAALRQGMEGLLSEIKQAVRAKAWHWKLVCCGGREDAFRNFRNAVHNSGDDIVILLVDAEEPVSGSARAHLRSRDGWDLGFVSEDRVHLMVQTMEAWIIADPNALVNYYGQSFRQNVLPKTANLETVAKTDISRTLEQATRDTQKGVYHKIHHAKDLLKQIDAYKVRQRCPSCKRLFDTLGRM